MSQMYDSEHKPSIYPEDKWITINGQIAQLVNTWSDRVDLTVLVGSSQGGATAFFDPKKREVEINTDVAFGENADPKSIGDLTQRPVQFDWPKASGAIFHEASHAKFTTWDLVEASQTLKPEELEALHLLEESRIEGLAVQASPDNRAFLRACALEIVLHDVQAKEVEESVSPIRQAVQLLALSVARVDAGVLKKRDVKDIKTAIEQIIPPAAMSEYSRLWKEFQALRFPDRQIKRMYAIAQRWAALTNDIAKDEDKKNEEEQKRQQEAMENAMKALGDAAGSTETSAQGEAYEQQRAEKREAAEKEREQKRQERGKNQDAAKDVFGRKTANEDRKDKGQKPRGQGGPLEYRRSGNPITEVRQPTDDERRSAIVVARALEKAKYHDRIRIESTSVTPPGRLQTRAAMQGSAYKSLGMRRQAEPFRRVQRKHEVDPNLTVGVMFDKSGSMGGAMEPMGITGWMLSDAVRRIDGKFAMVTYGHDVQPVIKPGQREDEVVIYDCPDGSEAFGYGFQALDGMLELLGGRGARLLVVVSDGAYKPGEIENVPRWLKRCDQEGVAVLWLGYGSSSRAEAFCSESNAQFVRPVDSPAGVAKQIADAAVAALNRAGAGA